MAGAGFKTFNTGDVLTASDVNTYLMQQTVMVFASAAARTTALGANVAEGMLSYLKDTDVVEVYNGSAWVSSDDPNAIQNTIVDAKGDLISATAADTPARLAVGTNGQVLTADSSTATGLKWASTSGGFFKNPVINSNMSVWQRGTSFTVASTTNTYTADRWCARRLATGMTISRQTTSDTTNLPNIQYSLRMQRDSGNTGTNPLSVAQSFESVDTRLFVGKTVTISYYARRGANYSATSNAFNIDLYTGTGTDENVQLGYTGSALSIQVPATLTTTWQRFSATGSIPSTATEMGLYASYTPTGTASTNDWVEFTGVQIEIGSSATDYYPNGNTYQAELAACQRYYWRSVTGNALSRHPGAGAYSGTTNAYFVLPLPVQMRIAPSSVDFSSLYLYDYGSDVAVTNISITANQQSANAAHLTVSVASGGTQYRPVQLTNANNANGYIGFSAEL